MKTAYKGHFIWISMVLGVISGLDPLLALAQTPTQQFELPRIAQQAEADQLQQQGRQHLEQSQWQQALQAWHRARHLYREMGDRKGERQVLSGIGLAHYRLGNIQAALEAHHLALRFARELEDRQAEAMALGHLGAVYRGLGQYDRALAFHQQHLELARQFGERQSEANALSNLGIIYGALSQYDTAIGYFQQALALQQQLEHQAGVAAVLNNLGLAYAGQGQYQAAISAYLEAHTLQRLLGNRSGSAKVLGNLGQTYKDLGRYGQALVLLQGSLALERQIGDRQGQARSLGNLGLVQAKLGKYQAALEAHQQVLEIARQVGARQIEANALHNLGSVHYALNQYTPALALQKQALTLSQELGDQSGIATAFSNIGLVYFAQSQYEQAIHVGHQALTIYQEIRDRQGETVALGNLGNAYYRQGEWSRALDYYQQSLTLAKALGLRETEGRFLTNLGILLDQQGQTDLAIVFLKQAVNVREQIRQDLQQLPPSDQQSYANTVADGYRRLADLLLRADRTLEAQTVLDLLKLQEIEEFLQDVRGEGTQLPFLQPELALLKRFQASQESAISLLQELEQLTQQARVGPLSRQQQQRRRNLLQIRQALQGQFNDFIQQPQVQALLKQLSNQAAREPLDLAKLNSLQDNLATLNAVLLYPLVLEDRLELVITTPTTPPLRRAVPVSRTQLNRTIAAFRSALEHPSRDAITPAQQLYNWLIRPIEADLDQTQPRTILFAPDGQLRYIPLAALHTGQQWLTQRYQVTNITTTSQTDFDTPPQPQPRILAGAFADQSLKRTVTAGARSFSFQGLPFAGLEVRNLVTARPGTTALLDRELTVTRALEEIDLHQIIHFATHAAFVPSDPDASFIVFGEGQNPTLRDIALWSLNHVDLVVLSACETGLGGKLGNGSEILGLGYQFQVSGAKAVMASLWRVSDGGTQVLMTEFYQGLQRGISKAEALRQAQIALLNGTVSQVGHRRAGIKIRGKSRTQTASENLAHPYYWAPFILIGNGL